MLDDRVLFENSVYFRIVRTKRIYKTESLFYYKIRKNTITIRMINGYNINFLDIVRLLLKDRDFTDYYMSDRYNLYSHRYRDVYLRPATDKLAENMNTSFCIVEGGKIISEEFEMGPFYQFKDKECKIHIRHILLFIRKYLPNYIDMHEVSIAGGHKYYGIFNVTNFHKDSYSADHLRKHIQMSKELETDNNKTASFMERFHMSIFSPDDPDYIIDGFTEIRLYPFRTKVEWASNKIKGSYIQLYEKYKRFITEYTVVYIKNPLEDVELSKDNCASILLNVEAKQIRSNNTKKEFSKIFNYNNYI